MVEGPPGVLAGAEDPRLRHGRAVLILVLEVAGEPGAHDLIAEIAGRGAAERDRPQAVAVAPDPAAVIPRAGDQGVQSVAVVLLERLVDPERAGEVLLVPPADHVERRYAGPAHARGQRPLAPVTIVVGVLNEVVPPGHLALEMAGVDVRQRPEVEKPLVEIAAAVVERRELLGPPHHRQILEHRTEAEGPVVVLVVAEELVSRRGLRRGGAMPGAGPGVPGPSASPRYETPHMPTRPLFPATFLTSQSTVSYASVVSSAAFGSEGSARAARGRTFPSEPKRPRMSWNAKT